MERLCHERMEKTATDPSLCDGRLVGFGNGLLVHPKGLPSQTQLLDVFV